MLYVEVRVLWYTATEGSEGVIITNLYEMWKKSGHPKFHDGLKLARLQPTRAEQNNSHLQEM